MNNNHLHPKILQFREFINDHPKLRKEIRKNGRSWQEYYEKWILLGEDDVYWDDFKDNSTRGDKKEENKVEFFNQLMKYAETLDIDKVQKQVHSLSGTISTIQELIDQYQGSRKGPSRPGAHNSFGWFRD